MTALRKGDITVRSERADGEWESVAVAHIDGSISVVAPGSAQRITLNPGQARTLVRAWNELEEQRKNTGQ